MKQNRHLQNRDDFVSELGSIVIEDLLYRKSKVDSQPLNPVSKWEGTIPSDGTIVSPTADISSAVGYRYGLIKGQIFALDAYNDSGLHPRYDRFHNEIRAAQLITAGQMMDYIQNNYNGIVGDRKVFTLPAGSANSWIRPGSQIQSIIDSGYGSWATKYLSEGSSITDMHSRLSFFVAVNAKEHKIGENNDWVATAGREDPFYKTGYHRDATFRYFDGGENHRLFFAIKKDSGFTEHSHAAISEATSEITSPVSKILNGSAAFKNSITVGNFLSNLSSSDSSIKRYGGWLVHGYDPNHSSDLFAENFSKTYMSGKDVIQEVSGPPLFRKGTGTVTLTYGSVDIYGVGTNFQTVFGSASSGDRKIIRINNYDFEVVNIISNTQAQVAIAPSLSEDIGETDIIDLDWYYLSAHSIISDDGKTVDINTRFMNGNFDAQAVNRSLKFFRTGETLPRVEIGLDYHKYSSGAASSRGYVKADHVICNNFTWTNPDMHMEPADGNPGRFEVFGNFISMEKAGAFGALIFDCGNIVAKRSIICRTDSVFTTLSGGNVALNGLITHRAFIDLSKEASFFAFHDPSSNYGYDKDLVWIDSAALNDMYATIFTIDSLGTSDVLGVSTVFQPSTSDVNIDQSESNGPIPEVALWIGNKGGVVPKNKGSWIFTDKNQKAVVITDFSTSRVSTKTHGFLFGKGKQPSSATSRIAAGVIGNVIAIPSKTGAFDGCFGSVPIGSGALLFGGQVWHADGTITPKDKLRALLSCDSTVNPYATGAANNSLRCLHPIFTTNPYNEDGFVTGSPTNRVNKLLWWLTGSDANPDTSTEHPGIIASISDRNDGSNSLRARLRLQEILTYGATSPWDIVNKINESGSWLLNTTWSNLSDTSPEAWEVASLVDNATPVPHKQLSIDAISVDEITKASKGRVSGFSGIKIGSHIITPNVINAGSLAQAVKVRSIPYIDSSVDEVKAMEEFRIYQKYSAADTYQLIGNVDFQNDANVLLDLDIMSHVIGIGPAAALEPKAVEWRYKTIISRHTTVGETDKRILPSPSIMPSNGLPFGYDGFYGQNAPTYPDNLLVGVDATTITAPGFAHLFGLNNFTPGMDLTLYFKPGMEIRLSGSGYIVAIVTSTYVYLYSNGAPPSIGSTYTILVEPPISIWANTAGVGAIYIKKNARSTNSSIIVSGKITKFYI